MNAECRALGCDRRAVTEFLDGVGKLLALCEHHGDLLAVGFALKPPVSYEGTQE